MGPFPDTVECGTIASIYNVVFHFVLLRVYLLFFRVIYSGSQINGWINIVKFFFRGYGY
jgi:hypothetical protein